MTRMKKPSVTTMKGRLSSSKIGRSSALMIPRKNAIPINDQIEAACIPMISAAAATATVVTNQRRRNDCMPDDTGEPGKFKVRSFDPRPDSFC